MLLVILWGFGVLLNVLVSFNIVLYMLLIFFLIFLELMLVNGFWKVGIMKIVYVFIMYVKGNICEIEKFWILKELGYIKK